MRKKIIIACWIAAAIIFLPLSAAASERRMGQSYSITIRVECLTEAVEALHTLPGHDLHAHISPYDASFTRRMDAWAFRHAQDMLRDLGEVTHEHENVRHLGAELMQIETRLAVLTREIDRLSVLMAASTTLDVLIAVDNQLSRVSNERDWLTGRRNTLMNDAQTTLMHITLTERFILAEQESIGFGTRVADSFLASWRATRRFFGNVTVVLARISLPLMIWAVLAGMVALIVTRRVRKSKKGVVTHVQE